MADHCWKLTVIEDTDAICRSVCRDVDSTMNQLINFPATAHSPSRQRNHIMPEHGAGKVVVITVNSMTTFAEHIITHPPRRPTTTSAHF